MLKFATQLSDDYEYGIIWWGQSNATPNGTYTAGIDEDPFLSLGSNTGENLFISVGQLTGSTTVACFQTTVLTDGQYDGAQLRMGATTPSVVRAKGFGTVTATYASKTGTVDSVTNGSNLITVAEHGFQTGMAIAFIAGAGGSVPDPLVAATIYYVIRLTSSTFSLATDPEKAYLGTVQGLNDDGSGVITYGTSAALTVTWSTGPAAVSAGPAPYEDLPCYTVFLDGRDRTFENLRVLTPYLPDQKGVNRTGTPVARGYSVPATITDYDDLGLFLPFTVFEGIEGAGANETDDFDGTFDSVTPTTLVVDDVGNASGFADDLFNGAHLLVEHANGTSWGFVTDSAYAANVYTFTVDAWVGNGTPDTPTAMRAWFPHHTSNPHEILPGEGFLYPSNQSEPQDAVKNRPAGNASLGWGLLFGSLLPFGVRVADATGKRINAIPLAIDASGIMQTRTLTGTENHGWFDVFLRSDWNPSTSNGLAARLKKMIVTMAPAALTAESNTKPLRIIGIAGMQGETEAISVAGRAQYKNLLPMFYQWLRNVIQDAGLNYYSHADKIPIVHAGIHKVVWEETVANKDEDGIVNSAITNFAAKTPFVSTIDVNDSDISTVTGHYDAVGEAKNARLLAAALLKEIDESVSSEDDPDSSEVVDICNMALSHIGDVAKITSLNTTTDTSAQASYCAKFYDRARESLLQQQAWAFATRRSELIKVDDARDEEWAFAYGVPNNAVRVFAVLPPEAGDDYSSGIHGTAVVRDASGALRNQTSGEYIPRPFTVEQDDDGHQIIYTDVDEAVGRYNVLIADARQYSPLFKNALALKLASMLAGPIIKGPEGVQMTASLLQMMEFELGKARKHDAVQHNVKPDHTPPVIRARW